MTFGQGRLARGVFTSVEIVIAVATLALLATLAFPRVLTRMQPSRRFACSQAVARRWLFR
jgi:hypothetical protein